MAHKRILGSRMCMPNFYKGDFSEGIGGEHQRPLPNVLQLKLVPIVSWRRKPLWREKSPSTKVACKSSCIHSSFKSLKATPKHCPSNHLSMQLRHRCVKWHWYHFPPPYDPNNLLDIEVSHIGDPSDSVKKHIWNILHSHVMRIQHDLLNESNQVNDLLVVSKGSPMIWIKLSTFTNETMCHEDLHPNVSSCIMLPVDKPFKCRYEPNWHDTWNLPCQILYMSTFF